MIADHVWRAPYDGRTRPAARLERPCGYMNCHRPRTEHRRATSNLRRGCR